MIYLRLLSYISAFLQGIYDFSITREVCKKVRVVYTGDRLLQIIKLKIKSAFYQPV